MSSGRCRKHGMFLVKPIDTCTACAIYVADMRRIAQIPLSIATCGRCEQSGILNWRTHKIWHAAKGGSEQFDLALYDKLMEARA